MDNTLLTLLVGGFLSLAGTLTGTYLANYFNLRRDREQWERQRQVEREKLEREERARAKEQLRDIYINCIRSLTLFENVFPGYRAAEYKSLTREEREAYRKEEAKYYAEAQHWLWLLSINLKDIGSDDLKKFNMEMGDFVEGKQAGELRQLIWTFARNDSRLTGYMEGVAELPPFLESQVRELPNV